MLQQRAYRQNPNELSPRRNLLNDHLSFVPSSFKIQIYAIKPKSTLKTSSRKYNFPKAQLHHLEIRSCMPSVAPEFSLVCLLPAALGTHSRVAFSFAHSTGHPSGSQELPKFQSAGAPSVKEHDLKTSNSQKMQPKRPCRHRLFSDGPVRVPLELAARGWRARTLCPSTPLSQILSFSCSVCT